MREAVLGALLAAVLVILLSVFLGRETAPLPRTAIVEDDGGAFRELVLHFDPAAANLVGPTYRDLLHALDPAVVVYVVVAAKGGFEHFRRLLAEWAVPGQERFRPVVVGRPLTTWSRDRYTLLTRGGERLLMVPPRPNPGHVARHNDWTAPFAIAQAVDGVGTWSVPLVFDGGDLTATSTHVLATAVLLGRNEGGSLGDRETLLRFLADQTDRVPVIIGRRPEDVPQHHIGMFVTPLGPTEVLAGDADAGLALLDEAGEAMLPLPVDRREETLRTFRLVAQELEREGFDVRRVPLVPMTDGLTFVTYNNAILERRAGGRMHAYVPVFGLPRLDRAGRSAYESAGVIVHPIDARRIYRYNGTVRCLVNVLSRESGG